MTSMESLLSDETDENGDRMPDYNLLEAIVRNKEKFVDGKPALLIGTDAFINTEIRRHRKGKRVDDESLGYNEVEIERVVEACERLGLYNNHFLILSNLETDWQDFVKKA